MPLQQTSGAASYDAFGGGVAAVPKYIEEYFSTFLYSGTGSSQTINNGIDLATKGGLVWIKDRTQAYDHGLFDTSRGAGYRIISNSTAAENYSLNYVSSFNNNGFSIGSPSSSTNTNGDNYVSWTLAKAPKFFDVVTYTGNGTAGRTVAHSLGSAPACMLIKRLDDTTNWAVYHRSIGATKYLILNSTAASATFSGLWNDTEPSSTTFTLGNDGDVNASGSTYVAYLFAHNAGGFGLTGTDNVISCGSFTTDGSSSFTPVNLGYEPQWLMIKASSQTSNWVIVDNMRGLPVGADDARLLPNTSDAETTTFNQADISATGFGPPSGGSNPYGASQTYIYIAIRRGPMKVPTSGTSVFAPSTGVEPSSSPLFTAGFSDMTLHKGRIQSTYSPLITDRLRGKSIALYTSNTNADSNLDPYFQYDSNAGAFIPAGGYFNNAGGGSDPYALYAFRRAPSFFDEVCYTGTGSARTVAHNLGVAPELMIVKSRSQSGGSWNTWTTGFTISSSSNEYVALNSTSAKQDKNTSEFWGSSYPTASVFGLGDNYYINNTGDTYVAYLFATCPNVSKVTTFTGNGSSQTINCGFTSGARFVMIKRVDSTGNWVTFDTARGISSGGDPALYLNSTAAEVTGVDAIDTDSTGFIVNQESTFNLNVSSATYLVLAIA